MSRSRAELVQVEIEPGWWLSSGRALFLEAEKTLVVAEIHWGFADSHRRVGNLLPLWGNAETAQRLCQLLEFYRPARMIWLGDSLHTSGSAEAAEEFLSAYAPQEMIVLRGNHDRKWSRITGDHFQLGRCFFHHGDREFAVEPGLVENFGIFPLMFAFHRSSLGRSYTGSSSASTSPAASSKRSSAPSLSA